MISLRSSNLELPMSDIGLASIDVRCTPQKRTSELGREMSALCQKQTLATLRLSEKTPSSLAKRFRRTRVNIDTIVERYRINANQVFQEQRPLRYHHRR